MNTFFRKLYLLLFSILFLVWIGNNTYRMIITGRLVDWKTVPSIAIEDPAVELMSYGTIALHAVVNLISYPLVIMCGAAYLRHMRHMLQADGWRVMAAVLLFMFIPLEMYCMYLDWKLIGLEYWGTWPLEEFRNAFIRRISAMAGLPFVAYLCYLSIIPIIIFRPLQKKIV